MRFLSNLFAERLKHWIPDPFVFAVMLTVITAVFALLSGSDAQTLLDGWYKGFWMLMEFAMQMVLMLVTGYSIALSSPVRRLIDKLAAVIKTDIGVYCFIIIFGSLLALISWSFIVISAVIARELANRVNNINYPFLVACVFLSMVPWVGGFSSSIPLLLNTESNFLIKSGLLTATIPIDMTLVSGLNACFIAMFIIIIPIMMLYLRPTERHEEIHPDEVEEASVQDEANTTRFSENCLSDRLNHNSWLQIIVALGGLFYIARHFYHNGLDLNLNIMIFLFLMSGLLLHRTPMNYVVSMKRSSSNISGIIFQYPFYGGIMGLIIFTPLGDAISQWLTSFASLELLPALGFMAGAVVNFAIPSAGGEWAVIGPPLIEAVKILSIDLSPAEFQAHVARIGMSAAYGETISNLIQPFFLLIILPVMGAGVNIQARDVMGYLVLPFFFLMVAGCLLVTFYPL